MPEPTIVHLRDVAARPKVFTAWEKQRHSSAHWFVECAAEFIGVFIYVYCGIGSQAAYTLGNLLKVEGLGSLFQIGISYAAGIVLSITVCAATSGGHLSPGVTITMVVFKGFPPLKGLRYIIAQILGCYVACLLCYVQYRDWIVLAEAGLVQAGANLYTPQTPAGIFAIYVMPNLGLGRIFLNEFVACTFLSIVIWAALDPTNVLIPPFMGPFVVAMAYFSSLVGYAFIGVALNSARAGGGLLAALTLYGTAASGGKYTAIATLTNIPATIFGVFLYEIFLTDSDRVIPLAQRDYISVHKNHGRALANYSDQGSHSTEKTEIQHHEV